MPVYIEQDGGGGGTGDVTGTPPTTIGAIPRWLDAGATMIGNSNFIISPDGNLSAVQPDNDAVNEPFLSFTGGELTGLTASTEYVDVIFNLSAPIEKESGNYQFQRSVVFLPRTLNFEGASSILAAVNVHFAGIPISGTNADIDTAIGAVFGAIGPEASSAFQAGQMNVFVPGVDGGLGTLANRYGVNIGAIGPVGLGDSSLDYIASLVFSEIELDADSAVNLDFAAHIYMDNPYSPSGNVTLGGNYGLYSRRVEHLVRWDDIHDISSGPIAGLTLANTNSANSGTVQYSPGLQLIGRSWDSSGPGNTPWNFMVHGVPESGAGQLAYYNVSASMAGGSWTDIMTLAWNASMYLDNADLNLSFSTADFDITSGNRTMKYETTQTSMSTTVGPTFILADNKSPGGVNGDVVSRISSRGNDNTGTEWQYGALQVEIANNDPVLVDGRLTFVTPELEKMNLDLYEYTFSIIQGSGSGSWVIAPQVVGAMGGLMGRLGVRYTSKFVEGPNLILTYDPIGGPSAGDYAFRQENYVSTDLVYQEYARWQSATTGTWYSEILTGADETFSQEFNGVNRWYTLKVTSETSFGAQYQIVLDRDGQPWQDGDMVGSLAFYPFGSETTGRFRSFVIDEGSNNEGGTNFGAYVDATLSVQESLFLTGYAVGVHIQPSNAAFEIGRASPGGIYLNDLLMRITPGNQNISATPGASINDFLFASGGKTWIAGTMTEQVFVDYEAQSIGFTGVSDVEKTSMVRIAQPTAGLNATILQSYALEIENLLLNGSVSTHITPVNTASYTVTQNDYLILTIRSLTGVSAINLPSCADVGTQQLVIKDAGMNATANNVAIQPDLSDTIDGVGANLILAVSGGSYTLQSDGVSNWSII